MLNRFVTRATFFDGFITGITIAITVLMLVFACYLRAFEYRATTIAVIIGIAFNIFIIVGGTISRVRLGSQGVDNANLYKENRRRSTATNQGFPSGERTATGLRGFC